MTTQPWLAHYEPGVPTALPAADGVFHDALHAAAAGAPSLRAVTCANRTVTFADLETIAGRVATALQRDGVGPGDTVLVALPNGIPLVATALGALRIGAVVAPVDPALPDADLAAAARASAPAVAVVAARRAPTFGRALPDACTRRVVVRTTDVLSPFVRWVLRTGSPRRARADLARAPGTVTWPAWLPRRVAVRDVPIAPSDPALRTCGPDGDRVTFGHAHLAAGAAQLRVWLPDAVPGDDTWLVLATLASPFGFVVALGTAMSLRARVALLPVADARAMLAALRYLRPAYVAASGAAVRALAADPSLPSSDLRSVRAWLVGDPLPARIARQFEEAAGIALCPGFAPPGAAGLATCNPVAGRAGAWTAGLPLPGIDVRVVRDDGSGAAPRETGRLEFAGPNVVAPQGWLASGARGHVDDKGFVHLTDAG